jgi:hypothetical protein
MAQQELNLLQLAAARVAQLRTGSPQVVRCNMLQSYWSLIMAVVPPVDRRMRVLIADDHPVVRGIVRSTLQQHPHIVVCGEAKDGAEALCPCLCPPLQRELGH